MPLLTVISANPSPTKGGFVVKLQGKVTKSATTAFGYKETTSQETYYMKLQQAPVIGFQAELDMTPFRVEELPMEIEDGDTTSPTFGKMITIYLKWLFLK